MSRLLLGYHLCGGKAVVMGVHHALGVERCRVAPMVVADNVYDLTPLEMACWVSLEGGSEALLAGDSPMGAEQIDLVVGY